MIVDNWISILKKTTFCVNNLEREELLERICANSSVTRVLSFVNVQAFIMSESDSEFKKNLLVSDYILRDGVGVKLLCEAAGIIPGLNLNGTDLIPDLINHYRKDSTVLLMGTRNFALEPVRKKLMQDGFSKVEVIDGFQHDDAYLHVARMVRPDLIIMAMGMPKQERIAYMLRNEMPEQGMLIINGGAILDFMSGHVKRAPGFLRKTGLEWLYRLLNEPRRLWKRNLMSVKFLAFVSIYKHDFRKAFMD